MSLFRCSWAGCWAIRPDHALAREGWARGSLGSLPNSVILWFLGQQQLQVQFHVLFLLEREAENMELFFPWSSLFSPPAELSSSSGSLVSAHTEFSVPVDLQCWILHLPKSWVGAAGLRCCAGPAELQGLSIAPHTLGSPESLFHPAPFSPCQDKPFCCHPRCHLPPVIVPCAQGCPTSLSWCLLPHPTHLW